MKLPYPLILASTSKYRQALLGQLGLSFEAMAPGVDEEQIKEKGLPPDELALELSRLKALAVYSKTNDSCVIGSDQICSFENQIFDKPGSMEKAEAQLFSMQGKAHTLLTAVTLMSPKGTESFLNRTTLHMRSLTQDEIRRYLKEDQPFDCAGSYKLESRGIKLFHKIDMIDHTAIIGLPLIELNNRLLKLGYPL